MTPEPLWRPSAAAVESSNLTAYIDWLRAERGVEVTTYPDLWRWSVADLEAFWNSIFDYLGVQADGECGPALSGKVVEVPVKRILMGADPSKVVSRDSREHSEHSR